MKALVKAKHEVGLVLSDVDMPELVMMMFL